MNNWTKSMVSGILTLAMTSGMGLSAFASTPLTKAHAFQSPVHYENADLSAKSAEDCITLSTKYAKTLGMEVGSSPYIFTEDVRIKVGESINMHYAQPLVVLSGVKEENIADVRKSTTYGKQTNIAIEGDAKVSRLLKNSAGEYCLPITITGKKAGTAIVTGFIVANGAVGGTATRVIVTEADKTTSSSSAIDKADTKTPASNSTNSKKSYFKKSATESKQPTATPKKSDSSTPAASSKSVTIARTQPQKGTSSAGLVSYNGVANKNGSESITLENVVATKKEKITVTSRPNAIGKTTTYKFTATVYEIPAESKIITTSKPVGGAKSVLDIEVYRYDAKSKSYVTQQRPATFNIGVFTADESDVGALFQPTIEWSNGTVCGSATYDDVAEPFVDSTNFDATTVFVRIVAAK